MPAATKKEEAKNNTEKEVSKAKESAEESIVTMSEAIQQLKEATTHIYEAVGSIGTATNASAHEKLAEGRDKAQDLYEAGKEKAVSSGHQAEDAIRKKPLAAVGVAFAAGLVVSRLLKGSK